MTIADTPKRAGRPPKAADDVARTRATRWTDADWETVKRVGMDRVRELVRAEDARQARSKAIADAKNRRIIPPPAQCG